MVEVVRSRTVRLLLHCYGVHHELVSHVLGPWRRLQRAWILRPEEAWIVTIGQSLKGTGFFVLYHQEQRSTCRG